MRISDWSSDVCSSDLRVCDAELVDSIYYSIFPNISPWGCYNPIFYRFRPDGDNPEQCIHEIMFMLPVPKGQDRPKPASIHWLGLNDDYMEAPALGSLAKVFNQEYLNLPAVARKSAVSGKSVTDRVVLVVGGTFKQK